MHKLVRQVRFSVNPFLSEQSIGANSFASMPAGEGLAVFLELSVELISDIDPATGFVVNVSEIDSTVRKYAVPVFVDKIKDSYRRAEHMSFFALTKVLEMAKKRLEDKFGNATLNKLGLKLNPYRNIAISSEDNDMVYFSEKFEFAATHKLWNEDFSEEKNIRVFGKCANPTGHGHNYVIEVTIKVPVSGDEFNIGGFEGIVNDELITLLDHRNLNLDLNYFDKITPTVENIAIFAWKKLNNKFPGEMLHCITVWETDKTSCSYYGEK